MKLSKTQICLYIFEKLITEGQIDIHQIKDKFSLEDKTFMRYINEIRSYLYNFYKGKDIAYIRSKQMYKLISYENDK